MGSPLRAVKNAAVDLVGSCSLIGMEMFNPQRKKTGYARPVVMAIAGVISYFNLPASASVMSKIGSAALVGLATSPMGATVGGIVGGLSLAFGAAVIGGGAGYLYVRDREFALDAAKATAYAGFFVGAVLGAFGGLYYGYNWTQDYFKNLLDKQNDPKTSSMNVEFGQSATPYFKELQEKLKAEKGLVLDIAPKANAPKFTLS